MTRGQTTSSSLLLVRDEPTRFSFQVRCNPYQRIHLVRWQHRSSTWMWACDSIEAVARMSSQHSLSWLMAGALWIGDPKHALSRTCGKDYFDQDNGDAKGPAGQWLLNRYIASAKRWPTYRTCIAILPRYLQLGSNHQPNFPINHQHHKSRV